MRLRVDKGYFPKQNSILPASYEKLRREVQPILSVLAKSMFILNPNDAHAQSNLKIFAADMGLGDLSDYANTLYRFYKECHKHLSEVHLYATNGVSCSSIGAQSTTAYITMTTKKLHTYLKASDMGTLQLIASSFADQIASRDHIYQTPMTDAYIAAFTKPVSLSRNILSKVSIDEVMG